jgi:hypothetical protein
MSPSQMKELLLQALEHGRGVVLVYRTALECAVNDHLRSEWERYFDQTENHVRILTRACIALGLDPGERTPGCEIVHHIGIGLVVSMKRAMATGDAQAAELVACECVVLAETRDHANWDLLCECAKALDGDSGRLLAEACADVAEEEDEHLYRARCWSRELWLRSLGLQARIPPEKAHAVATAVEAAAGRSRARAAR